MAELELTRTAGDRRLYTLGDVGALSLQGLFARGAIANAAGETWRFSRRILTPRFEATDAAGAVVGTFEPRGVLRRGGTVHWAGRELALRPASVWRERYALAVGDRELAQIEGKGWGSRPVKVNVDDPGQIEPGLLLFAVFIVRRLAEDAQSGASAGASTAATGAVSGS